MEGEEGKLAEPPRGYSWPAVALGISIGLLIHLGAFKGTSALSDLPVDPTVGLAVIVMVLGLVANMRNRISLLPAAWPLLALWTAFTLGIPFLGSTAYAHQKVILLFTLCAGIAFVSCVMSDRRGFLTALLWTQVVAGTVMAALLRFYGSTGNSQARLLLEGSNSIGAARVVGAAIVVLFVLSFRSRGRLLVHGLAILALSTILIGIGSRGPLIFAAIASLAAARFSRWSHLKRPVRPLASVLVIGGIAYYFASHYETRRLPLARVLSPLTEGLSADQSFEARLLLIKSSLSVMFQNPLGVGWGNFAPAARADGLAVYLRHAYPHNVILEVGVEAGIAALVIFLLVMVAALRALYRSSVTPAWAAAFALGIYSVGNALVSGDITSNRPMWCIIGLGIGCLARRAQIETATASQSNDPRIGEPRRLARVPARSVDAGLRPGRDQEHPASPTGSRAAIRVRRKHLGDPDPPYPRKR